MRTFSLILLRTVQWVFYDAEDLKWRGAVVGQCLSETQIFDAVKWVKRYAKVYYCSCHYLIRTDEKRFRLDSPDGLS